MSPDRQLSGANSARPAVTALAWLCIGIVVIGVTYTVFAIRDTQTSNSPVLKSTAAAAQDAKRAADTIQDCVEPGGKCYERGQEQTAKAVGDIGQLQVNAVACAFTETQGAGDIEPAVLAKRITRCLQELADSAADSGPTG